MVGGIIMYTELPTSGQPDITPYGFLYCDGSSLSRTTFSLLYDKLTKSKGTVTITIMLKH